MHFLSTTFSRQSTIDVDCLWNYARSVLNEATSSSLLKNGAHLNFEILWRTILFLFSRKHLTLFFGFDNVFLRETREIRDTFPISRETMVTKLKRMIQDRLILHASRLRFPKLLLLAGVVFVTDLIFPDVIPFVDEILLGLITLLLSTLKKRNPSQNGGNFTTS
jgi:hypothetical protein